MNEKVDILCVAAHPDDAELYCSGTLMATAERGGSWAICDLTAGERGSRGSVEIRRDETIEANRRMGLPEHRRLNLGLPDGSIRLTEVSISRLVEAIRHFSPDILLIPSPADRHPDHGNAHRLGHEAWFNAGLVAVETSFQGEGQSPWRPRHLLTYDHVFESEPDIIVDISSTFQRKVEALAAYGTQFTLPGKERSEEAGRGTLISGTDFFEFIVARMRRNGFRIGAEYGEGFHLVGSPVPMNDLRALDIFS